MDTVTKIENYKIRNLESYCNLWVGNISSLTIRAKNAIDQERNETAQQVFLDLRRSALDSLRNTLTVVEMLGIQSDRFQVFRNFVNSFAD